MDVWKGIIVIVSVLGFFAFGVSLMARLDRFLEKNRKKIEKEDETETPSRIMITEDMSDEEIAAEIRKFREKHKNARIALYDSEDKDFSDR